MDGRKGPGYSKRPSFYDLKYWSEDEVRASYGAAIERWEKTLGREAPPLAKPKGTLNVEFIEWMMCRAQDSWRPSETHAHPNRLPKPFTTGYCN